MKRYALALIAALLATALLPAVRPAEAKRYVTIGTGGVTGVYYPVGKAIAKLVNTQDAGPDFRVTAESTGGSVFNTAIALGRLGAPAAFFTGLSTDLFGQMLERSLEASQVDAGMAARSDRPTTLAFVTLEDGQARYAFYDENTAGRLLAEADRLMYEAKRAGRARLAP